MRVLSLKIPMAAVLLTLLIAGCDSRDERLVRMATDSARQQADQNRNMAELQKEVAAGARSLVAADAQSREALIGLQRDLQTERSEIGRQRDRLEVERREVAAQRRSDPIRRPCRGVRSAGNAQLVHDPVCFSDILRHAGSR